MEAVAVVRKKGIIAALGEKETATVVIRKSRAATLGGKGLEVAARKEGIAIVIDY